MRIAFSLLAVCVLGVFTAEPAYADGSRAAVGAPSTLKWTPWAELGGFYGTDNTSFGEAIVFAPLMQGSRDLLFFEGRGKLFEEEAREGNFALGYRQMTSSGFNLGVWLGGDVRNSELDNTFEQLSGGLEALSADFDARVNVYGPITGPQAGAPGFTQVVLQGNNIFMVGGQEVGLHGVDGEVGVRLPVEKLRIDPSLIEFRLYGGGFYFDNSDALSDVSGGKARAELRINDVIPAIPGSRLTAEYQISHDDVRETRQVIGARLRLPIDPPDTLRLASLTAQERRMIDPIERDIDVVTTQSKAEPVKDALTKVDFDKVAYVQGGGDLTATSTAAGANTLIIASNGTITGPQALQGQQTLQGGASTINVQGQRSGTIAPFTAPGSRPTFSNDQDNSAISVLGSSVHIAGIDLEGAGQSNWMTLLGNAGITDDCSCTPVLNTFIENVNITEFSGVGIAFYEGSEITVLNTTVSHIGDVGIAFGNDNHVTLSGVTVSDVYLENGIEFIDGNTVSITNTVVTGITGFAGPPYSNGISFGDENHVTLANVSVSHVYYGDGIAFGSDNHVSITGASVSDIYNDGISFLDNNGISISDTSISGVEEFGISMGYDNKNFSITRTTISDVCCAGIMLFGGNTGVISNTTITDSHNFGILLYDAHNEVAIRNVTVSDVAFNGLEISGAPNTVELSNSTFSGTFGGFAVSIDNGPNDLSGTGNVFNATAGGLCNPAAPPQSGNFTFTSPPQTCP